MAGKKYHTTEQNHAYYLKNKDEINKKGKEYYLKNKEKIDSQHREYYYKDDKQRWKEYYQKNRERLREKNKNYNRINNKKIKFVQSDLRTIYKITTLFIYSDGYMKCAICGEDDIDVLDIDHINGSPPNSKRSDERKNLKNYLVKEGFPDGFRVLCRNCNWKQFLLKKYGTIENGG